MKKVLSINKIKKQCYKWEHRGSNRLLKTDIWRPRKRSECPADRPCQYITCRYHMYLDYTERGEIYLYNELNKKLKHIKYTCFWDIMKEKKKLTLQEIANLLGITKERVRQIEVEGLKKLRAMENLRLQNEV